MPSAFLLFFLTIYHTFRVYDLIHLSVHPFIISTCMSNSIATTLCSSHLNSDLINYFTRFSDSSGNECDLNGHWPSAAIS